MTLTHHTETRRPLACIILAAGKGTRMKSDQPKVLHKVAGRSMVAHVVAAASILAPEKVVVVVGPGMDSVAAEVAPHVTVVQEKQRGTGDAVMAARPLLEGFDGAKPVRQLGRATAELVGERTFARRGTRDATRKLIGGGVIQVLNLGKPL